jgi:hypothetical protein
MTDTPNGPFFPDQFYSVQDQCGPNGLFRSATGRQGAVDRGELDPGYYAGGRRINTGAQLNSYLELCRRKRQVPEGFGGNVPGAGRKRKNQSNAA